MKFSIEQEMSGATLDVHAQQRRELLRSILEKNGMDLRDDSRLAYRYIVQGGDPHLTAHEILSTNFLFEHTRYDENCQVQLRNIAESVHEMYGLPWKLTWSIVRQYCVPALKLYSLAESGKMMPEFDVSFPVQ